MKRNVYLAVTLMWLATVMMSSGLPSATAAEITDKNEGIEKDFSSGTMWQGEAAPTSVDRANVNYTLSGEYTYLSTAHTAMNLTLGKTSIDEGRMEIRNGGQLTLVGAVSGGGRVVMLGELGLGELDLLSGSTLTVTDGDIRLGSGAGANGVLTQAAGSTFGIGGNLTIATLVNAEGSYAMSGGTLTVRDHMIVGRQGTGTLTQTAGDIVINRGTALLPAIDPGLYISSHTGGTGIYEMSGGSLNVAGVNGGFRIGTPAGDNTATFRIIGDAPTITVASQLEVFSAANLIYEVTSGNSAIDVGGNVILAGHLGMTFSTTPTLGDEYTLINYEGTISGTFSGVDPFTTIGGIPFVVSYGKGFDSSVRAAVVPATILSGDFDLDNNIDADDYDLLLATFNTGDLAGGIWANYQLGDINFDTVVDYSDAQLFRTAFDTANGAGAFAAMLAGAPVPEPTTLWLLMAGGFALVLRRRFAVALGVVALSAFATTNEVAAQITYVDSVNGVNTFDRNGEAIAVVPGAVLATDGVWEFRTNLGIGGNAWQSFYTEKVDILKVTMTDLDPTYKYNVYAHFWTDTAQNWRVAGTLDPSDIDDNGTPDDQNDDFLPAVAGISFNAKGATIDGTTQAKLATTSGFAAPAPIVFDGTNRTLYNAHLGVAATDANNSISAYIGNFYAAGNNTGRVLFDGVGHSVGGVNLTLEVDFNGDVRIVNTTATDLSLDYYEITSTGGNLSYDTWSTLSSQNVGVIDGNDAGSTLGDSSTEKWGVTGGSVDSNSILAEFYLPGHLTLASGASWVIGNPVLAGATLENLSFRVGVQGYGVLDANVVLLNAPPTENADFNGDGIVNLADYTVWRDNLGASGTELSGDANGDEVVDNADYTVWKSQFGTSPGSVATLAASSNSAVPEPHTLALALCGLLGVALRRARKTPA